MLELTEKSYIAGIWMAAGPGCDLMICLHKDTDTEPWKITGRLRIHDPEDPGNDPWSGQDQKRRFSATAPADIAYVPEEIAVLVTAKAVETYRKNLGFSQAEYLAVGGSSVKLLEIIQGPKCPEWLYSKEITSASDTGLSPN